MSELHTIESLDRQPFKYMVATIGNLPTSFVDSMSYYELLAWLCQYLEKTVIPAIDNNAEALEELQAKYIELKAYVDNYFDNLDVQDEINNKLDAMAESGQLAEIINQEIFDQLNSDINELKFDNNNSVANNTLKFERVYRKIDKRNKSDQTDYDSDTTTPVGVQGGQITGSNKMLIARWDYDNQSENSNVIQEINFKTGETLKTKNYSYGYCNGLCVANGKVYITPRGHQVGGSNVNLNTIKVLDYATLDELATITSSEEIMCCGYYDSKLYALCDDQKSLIQVSEDDGSTIATITLDYDNTNLMPQSMTIDNGLVYLVFSQPMAIMVFKLSDGSLYKTYTIEDYLSGGLCYTGECEFVSVYDGNLYLGSNLMLSDWGNMIQLGKVGIKDGNLFTTFHDTSITVNPQLYIKVNGATTTLNPLGTSSLPFNEPIEACLMKTDKQLYVDIANGTYNTVEINGKNNMWFRSGNKSNTTIKGFIIKNCSQIQLGALTIVDTLKTNENAPIYLSSSRNCIIQNIDVTCANENATAGIYLEYSDANIGQLVGITSPTVKYFVDDRSDLKVVTAFNDDVTVKKGNLTSKAPAIAYTTTGEYYYGDINFPTALQNLYDPKGKYTKVVIKYTFGGTIGIAELPLASTMKIEKATRSGGGIVALSKTNFSISNDKFTITSNETVKYTVSADGISGYSSTAKTNNTSDPWYLAILGIMLV